MNVKDLKNRYGGIWKEISDLELTPQQLVFANAIVDGYTVDQAARMIGTNDSDGSYRISQLPHVKTATLKMRRYLEDKTREEVGVCTPEEIAIVMSDVIRNSGSPRERLDAAKYLLQAQGGYKPKDRASELEEEIEDALLSGRTPEEVRSIVSVLSGLSTRDLVAAAQAAKQSKKKEGPSD